MPKVQAGKVVSKNIKATDDILKSMLVFARSVEYVLETRAVDAAIGKPLSPSKVQILRLLDQRGVHTASQVGRFLGVSKPAVTQLIDAMVRAKLVLRRTAKADRREVRLSLSEKGKQTAQAVLKQQRHRVRAAMRISRGNEIGKWIQTLQAMASSLAEADEKFDHYCLQCGAHNDGTCVLLGGDAVCPMQADNRKPDMATRRPAKRSKRSTVGK